MPQYLKDEVRERIEAAALEVLAERGLKATTIAEVARRASVSTGNIYRYFPDKAALFDAVMPVSFARGLMSRLRKRIEALDGVTDAATQGAGSPFRVVSEDLLRFALSNRLRVVVLLGRAEGTPHERFADRLVGDLGRLALNHYRRLGREVRPTAALRLTLDRIYRNWITAIVNILSSEEEEARIREQVEMFSRYHLAGMNALFASR